MMNKYEALPPCLLSYTILSELGRGAFSTVYKVKYIPNGEIFCLKKITQKKNNHKFNEVKILQSIHHPHLIKFISSFVDDNYLYIVMEYCEYGDLYTLLKSVRKKGIYIMEDVLWDIAYQTLLGLEYIHNKQIIHRDIKLLNIFMNKDKIIKIGDLGMSKLFKKKELMQSRVGTPLYLPPELVKKEKYDFKVDIWSFGCSLYHLSKCHPPFNEENMIKLGHAIVNDTPPSLPDIYSEAFKGFLSLLMSKQKENRPSSSEALCYIPDKIKEKYKVKIMSAISPDLISAFNHNSKKILIDSMQFPSKVPFIRFDSTKKKTDMGDAGILFKKQIKNLKKKSGSINFNLTKKMNGTQEGLFKYNQSDNNKSKNKTQINFFNNNSNLLSLKGEIAKKFSIKYNNDIQREFYNLEDKKNQKNKEQSRDTNIFPVIGLKEKKINNEKKNKMKTNEDMFRATYTLFRSKNAFTKPLTINDIE